MPSKDKAIIKKHRDAWYYKNKDKQISRQMERRAELVKKLWNYKRTLSCERCGFSFKDYPECCDFHHLDPSTKEDTVYKRMYSSENAMQKEIEKCIPLCANCHRKEHSKDLYKQCRLSKE